jgi:hypothetical protein
MSSSNFGLLKKLSVMAVACIPFVMNGAEDKAASGDLFCLDFTKNTAKATLAVGSPDCKEGKAVFIKDGDKYCLNAGDKDFQKLKYSTAGNINSQEGTLQIKYKPSFSKDIQGQLKIYRLFLLAEKPDSSHFSIGLNSSEDGKRYLWVFLKNEQTEGKDHGVYQNVNMEKDVWYDISVTWDKDNLKLFLDKKLLGTVPMKGKLPEASSFYVGGSFYLDNAEGLVEYFKISPKSLPVLDK